MILPPARPAQLYTPPLSAAVSSVKSTQATSQLAEFASSMVYLMWHARKAAAKLSERNHSALGNNELAYLMWQSRKPAHSKTYSPLNDQSLSYTASPAFKKFCFQVLTATQLHESAVYLSLKYIAILLQSNPSIEGAEGSEYRLFIVALMLANKFLDDNTFTNKTWSDVSGMKVHDLNIMEAEFLEALDYNLFVREHEYSIWKRLLEECRERAQMSYYDSPRQQQHLVLMTLQTLGLYRIDNNSSINSINNGKEDYHSHYYINTPTSSSPSSPTSSLWEEQQQYEWESASRLQYESSRYQQFIQSSKLPTQLPYVVMHQQQQQQQQQHHHHHQHQHQHQHQQQPQIHTPSNSYGYNGSSSGGGYMNDYSYTNLSHASWDPLAYSLNRCHDISNHQQQHHFAARPISWRNFN